ncbi:MAG: hypothetical protein GKR94_24145 [Gammaproteobacteria bacterium]|nr:hypothetical protein [Gammaproteobacteria bacterium]
MHFFRDCGVSAVLQSSGITYHCCPIEHTNPLKFPEKLFSCFKHDPIVNFLCKSIGYTLCLTILWGSSDHLYTAVLRAVLPCTHEKITIFRGTLEYVARVVASRRKTDYIFNFYGIVDLLAVVPFYLSLGVDLRGPRALRLFRALRLLKLMARTPAADCYR